MPTRLPPRLWHWNQRNMKVKKLMTKSVGVCGEEESLAKAVEIMWQKDCGAVPIVNGKSKVIGMVTDRDVAVSVFLQNKPASVIRSADIINRKVLTCSSNDKIEKVLKTMKKRQIKRLPVVDKKRKLKGLISVTDILLASEKDKTLRKKVLRTLKAIAKPRSIVLKNVGE